MGRRIKRVRRQHHLTQEALAEKVGISCSFLGHLERGTRKASIETILKISEALNVSLDYLVAGVGVAPKVDGSGHSDEVELLREISRLVQHWLE